MTENKLLSIVLSAEELMVVLSYLKANDMAGLNLEKFASSDQEIKKWFFGIAEKALLAREFLVIDPNNHLALTPMVFALVGACAFPETSFVIKRNLANDPSQEYYFHLSRKMIVMHRTPMTDIHQFIALKSKKSIIDNIETILKLRSSKSQLQANGAVPRKILHKARDIAIKHGFKDTLKVLSKTDLDEETARLLAQTLSAPFVSTTLAVIKNIGKNADGFSLIQNEDTTWIISRNKIGKKPDDDFMHLSCTSPTDVLQRIAALVG